MALVSLTLPQVGQPNTTEDPKINTALNALAAAINGGLDVVNLSSALQQLLFRTGMIIPTAAAAADTGFLLCDGSAQSRTTYAALFGVIGTNFGAGDGSTTFNLPDLRQRFPLGKAASGTGSTLGGTGGAIDHSHTVNGHRHYHESPVGLNSGRPTIFSANDALLSESGGGLGNYSQDYSAGATVVRLVTGQTASVDVQTLSERWRVASSSETPGTNSQNPPFQVVNFQIKT